MKNAGQRVKGPELLRAEGKSSREVAEMMIFLLCVITIAIFLFGFLVISKVDDFLGDWRRDFDEDYDTRRDAARQSRKDSKGCRLFKKKFFTRLI